jgi:hypothetical protein
MIKLIKWKIKFLKIKFFKKELKECLKLLKNQNKDFIFRSLYRLYLIKLKIMLCIENRRNM